MTDATQMRAGNADRDRVIAALQEAYADGRLGEDELATRIDATRSARTFGDLDDVVEDLPIPQPSAEFNAQLGTPGDGVAVHEPAGAPAHQNEWAAALTRQHGPVGSSPENPLILDGGWSSEKRQGSWEIPQFLRLRGGIGSVVLDCTEARTVHQIIHLWVEGDLGSITVIVPEGWAADANGVNKSWGSISVKVPAESTMGRPTVVVNGSMGAGSLTIRHPNWFERKRLEKKLR